VEFKAARLLAESHRQAVTERVNGLLADAARAFQTDFAEPEILFNQRGAIAGSARLQRWQLRFQPQLLLANYAAFERQIIPHEVAHLVVYQQFGEVRPHGGEWQSVMIKLFDAEPARTHRLSAEGVAGRSFSYRCGCPEPHQLSIRRHNRIINQGASYRCRRCGEQLSALIPAD